MRGADILVEMLVRYEVDHIFGVPGDTNVPLYDAMRLAQDRIRHIMVRDERCGGFMADAYARLSNKPAVMEVPSGAGAMYVLPAVAEAHFSSVPMILITSDTPLRMEGQGVITELECAKLFEPVTKASWQVKSARKIPEMVRRAFRYATGGRPGAVHLVVPEDVLAETVAADAISLHAEAACTRFPSYPASPGEKDIDALIGLIAEARRPLFVAGGGASRSLAGKALQAVAEALGMPVVQTITGQSTLVDDHPLAIGVVGDNGFHPHANRAMEEADLIVYLGSKIGSVVTIGWTFPSDRVERKIVQIDIEATVLGNNTDNALSICADIRLALEALHDRLPQGLAVDPAWPAHLNAMRAEFWHKASAKMESDAVPLAPQRIVKALNDRLVGRPCSILSDPGTPTPHMTQLLRLVDPESSFIIPRAFGGLGYALPAVVGAYLARPHTRPIGLFGDGSFAMSMGELETLVRLDVPAILVHFSNGCFGWIKALQRLHGHNATYSVDFNRVDGAAIAEVFGARAFHVTTPDELDAAFDAAFAHDGLVFIDVEVESIADMAPPVYSWLKRMGRDPMQMGPTDGVSLADGQTR
ncbi:thiamine pyrophosphate-binding protein [Pelagibacterium lacus]|uniref:Thiamine pyrophosphate-binding protein n=1 Tax=Pelagibacterium lacus TaxID=2282655 RepID=A0A369W4I6_9HYPH|nr:thiamine pyrophosphate-binding protein [Pelagibacterium lacus]